MARSSFGKTGLRIFVFHGRSPFLACPVTRHLTLYEGPHKVTASGWAGQKKMLLAACTAVLWGYLVGMSKLLTVSRKRPYICDKCARKRKGKWPKGHLATCHVGECLYCLKTTTLASIGDYNWPNKSFVDMRD